MSDPYDLALASDTVRPVTEEERRNAALVACGRAADVAEARLFLAMLGLAGR